MTQANNLIKQVEQARAQLIEEIRRAVKKIGFNTIVDMGVNRKTLATIVNGAENIKVSTLINTKKILDRSIK